MLPNEKNYYGYLFENNPTNILLDKCVLLYQKLEENMCLYDVPQTLPSLERFIQIFS